jgi:hypothetical protein
MRDFAELSLTEIHSCLFICSQRLRVVYRLRQEMRFVVLLLALASCLLASSVALASPLLPILCVHGWNGFATDFATMIKEVQSSFPDRYIASVNLFDGKLSEELPIFEQASYTLQTSFPHIIFTLHLRLIVCAIL